MRLALLAVGVFGFTVAIGLLVWQLPNIIRQVKEVWRDFDEEM